MNSFEFASDPLFLLYKEYNNRTNMKIKKPNILILNILGNLLAEKEAPITLSSIVLYLYTNSGQSSVKEVD